MTGIPLYILLIVIATAVLGLATWMHKKGDADVDQNVIWSIVQLMCVLVILAGAFFTYNAVANPPKPEVEGPMQLL